MAGGAQVSTGDLSGLLSGTAQLWHALHSCIVHDHYDMCESLSRHACMHERRFVSSLY